MADQVVNYQCPSCTGPLHFDSATGKLACDFCGSVFEVAEIEALYAQKEEQASTTFQKEEAKKEEQAAQASDAPEGEWGYSGDADWGADGAGMKAYSCPSCAAELICDATTAATSCPYCGNPTIVPGQFAGTFKPDFVLPFKLKKEDAVRALKKHYEGKPLLPKAFSEENHVQEIKGVYVPFWLFNGEVDIDMDMDASSDNSYEQFNERITETKHYRLHREGTVAFERIPADGSSKMPDDYMDSIEPFDYGDLKPFSVAYLPGFLAEKYDVPVEECAARADERARNTARQAVINSAGFVNATPVREEMDLRRGKVDYALLPVWMLSTRYEGKNYLFAMNGQTGKMVGDLPSDSKRWWEHFIKFAIPSTAVVSAILFALTKLLM